MRLFRVLGCWHQHINIRNPKQAYSFTNIQSLNPFLKSNIPRILHPMNKNKKHIVVLTGAGVSAESGISTFRDSGGLWEDHDVMEVASVEGWSSNKELVLDFYNKRRKQAATVKPNPAHIALAELEQEFEVDVITQNVDDLHEQAGSTRVLHLHGKLREARSEKNPDYIIDIGDKPILLGDVCPKGGQLRPNIVWFGEMVPNIEPATELVSKADILLIVGTSLVVYPAAGLVNYAPPGCEIYLIDPSIPDAVLGHPSITCLAEKAGVGTPKLVSKLINEQKHV